VLVTEIESDDSKSQDAKAQGASSLGIVENGYRVLKTPVCASGCFSALSPATLFAVAMCGIDVDPLLAAAVAMDKRISKLAPLENPAALLAAIHYLLARKGKRLAVTAPYSESLDALAAWTARLWGETVGLEKLFFYARPLSGFAGDCCGRK